ncbi:MAG: twin-arginine translocation pathway signal protein [wastewater metagenome]|nr:twin-arginine translocation pathway signal protein [Candidatus Loosdrechtia aerotolerans]
MTEDTSKTISRRFLLKIMSGGIAGLGFTQLNSAWAQISGQAVQLLPSLTGPNRNPYWNSTGPFVVYPQKLPLIQITDRPVQLETPRHYFLTPFTPNAAFFVRWHLDKIPNAINLSEWRLFVEGNVERPLILSLNDLMKKFKQVSVTAVNQCSGNSRSRFQPHIPGGQWGNGAMGNATMKGVRLKDVLDAARIKSGSLQVQCEGLDRGRGPKDKGSYRYQKSLYLNDPILHEVVIAYEMNGAPLPILNGFPVRLVVPGKFATYWIKALTWIRIITEPDTNFWMTKAYCIPDTPHGNTTPEDMERKQIKQIPIGTMPVRSFLITPDGSDMIPLAMPLTLQGIAFSGHGQIVKVEFSDDNGITWHQAKLGKNYGRYSFRTWKAAWIPKHTGKYTLTVRATDEKGNTQADEGIWNPGGYLWNKIERQEVVIGVSE